MELKKLFKSTSFLLGSQVVKFLAGILRSKLNAIFLGITGIGIFNQLNFATQQIAQFSLLSMSEAAVKQIAERDDDENLKRIVSSVMKTYIILILVFMVIIIILLVIFSESLTTYLFGSPDYLKYFIVAILTLPLLILNSIPFSILKAFKNVKAISQSRIVTIIINLSAFIPLVVFWGISGATWFVPFSYLTTLMINLYFARKYHFQVLHINLGTILSARTDHNSIKEMLSFSGFGLVVMSYMMISELACRSIVITNLGIEQIGLYSPIITWTGLFTGFLLPTFNTYLFPRLCETKTDHEVSGIINDGIRLTTLFLIPFLFLGIVFRTVLIRVFYSIEFLDAANYLPWHFIGLAFYVWFYSIALALTPTGRIKWNSIFWMIYLTINILTVYLLTPHIGLYAWMLKHIIGPVVFFLLVTLFFRKTIKFRIEPSNQILMVYLLLCSFGLILLDKAIPELFFVNYIASFTLLLGSYLLLRKEEKALLFDRLGRILSRIKGLL